MNLIVVHSERPESHHCEICDGPTVQGLTKWYEYRVYHDEFGLYISHYALDCCKHKGNIIDWEERIINK